MIGNCCNCNPPATNQHGQGHWPVLRIVVMARRARTGLAQQPCWGPMYGPQAVSEQALGRKGRWSQCPGMR